MLRPVDKACRHAPDQTYTRETCVCGRPLWPPRGRGRGESLLSPRRIDAKMRALDVMWLHTVHRMTYDEIARRLGYRTPSGAWRAEHRIRQEQLAMDRYRARRHKRSM